VKDKQMKKDKMSRRDFLKLSLLSLGAGFLAACKQVVKPLANAVATFTATPSKTNTPTSTKTNTPEPTSTEMQTPTPTEIPCFRLLSPENGAKLPAVGKVTFSWEAMQGAILYKLEITLPSNQSVIFETDKMSRDQYLEAFSMGGKYQWQVSAFDTNSTVICTSEPFVFEKDIYTPPHNNGGGNDDGSGSDGPITTINQITVG